MNLDVNIILSILVAFQLLFIAIFVLVNSKGNRKSNLLLGIFFLVLSINVIDILMQINGVWSFVPLFFLLDDSFLLLYGPLIYFYVKSYILKDFTFSRRHWLHFIPFVLCFLGMFEIYSFVAVPYENSLEIISEGEVPKGVLIFVVAFYLHGLFYLWRSKKLLNTYDKKVKERFSNLSRINLSWLHFMINSFIIAWVLGAVQSILPLTVYRPHINLTLFVFMIFLFYFINRVVFKALKRPDLLSGVSIVENKYAGSTLSEEKRSSFAVKVVSLMESEQLHLNPDLSIDDLADLLNISPKELSQTINQSFDRHFFDFVNSYRINDAKNMLSDPNNSMTIQEIMYSVGFSSKSSFNTIFKKKTNKTPSQYRQASIQ